MDRIQLRRDTAANWVAANPVLLEGEVGYETDTNLRKIGDGVHSWKDLNYLRAEGIVQETGNSENAVMSQKAVTEKLTELGKDINGAKEILKEVKITFVNTAREPIGKIIPIGAKINPPITIYGYDITDNDKFEVLSSGVDNVLSIEVGRVRCNDSSQYGKEFTFTFNLGGSKQGIVQKIGDLELLETENKTSLTDAINEVDRGLKKQKNDILNLENAIGNEEKLLSFDITTAYTIIPLDNPIPKDSVVSAVSAEGALRLFFETYKTPDDKSYIQITDQELPYTLPDKVVSVFSSKTGQPTIVIGETSGIKGRVGALEKEVKELQQGETKIEVVIPDVVNAVVGDTLQIFHRCAIYDIDYNPHRVVVNCSVGKSFNRYYELTPTSEMAGKNYAASYNIFNTKGNLIYTKNFTIKVKATMSSPSSNKNVLVVGASLYSTGTVTEELRRRICDVSGDGTPLNPTGLGCSNVSFIGRKTGSVVKTIHQEASGGYGWKTYTTDAFKDLRFYFDSVELINMDDRYTIEGVSASSTYFLTVKEVNITDKNILCEVYGGYTYADGVIPTNGRLVRKSGSGDKYINYTSYITEAGNPFWNNGGLDFINYSNQYCDGASIDVICCIFGNNDMKSIDSVDDILNNHLKPFISKYHQDYPNGKVVLGTLLFGSLNGGYGSSNGARLDVSAPFKHHIYWEWNKKLIELVKDSAYSGYCILADSSVEYDVEYALPYIEKNVNNRISSTKERIDTDRIHPTEEGRKMLSDSMFRTLNAIFT